MLVVFGVLVVRRLLGCAGGLVCFGIGLVEVLSCVLL